MAPFRRWLLKSARTVHLYITLFGLALLLFFSITGFMLNHEDWFSPLEPREREIKGTIPAALLSEPNKLGIVELLRKEHGATGVMDSFSVNDDDMEVVFKRPGEEVKVTIQRESGDLSGTHTTRGSVGVILDLHRGKSSGIAWSLIIDGLCILVVIVCATGVYLWASLRGRGAYSGLVLLLGTVLGLVVYFVWVP
jgi:uncharacterized protein